MHAPDIKVYRNVALAFAYLKTQLQYSTLNQAKILTKQIAQAINLSTRYQYKKNRNGH